MTSEGLLTKCDVDKVDNGINSDKYASEDGEIVRFDHNVTCLNIKLSLTNIPQCQMPMIATLSAAAAAIVGTEEEEEEQALCFSLIVSHMYGYVLATVVLVFLEWYG